MARRNTFGEKQREVIIYQYLNFFHRLRLGKHKTSKGPFIKAILLVVLFLGGYGYISSSLSAFTTKNDDPKHQALQQLPSQTDFYSNFKNYPEPDTFPVNNQRVAIFYQTDSLVNARMSLYLARYRPEVAVYLACDLQTGNILALGERKDSVISARPALTFGGKFPAASLVKLVSASAALEAGRKPQDSLVQIGSYYTLYKRQLRPHLYTDPPKITFKKAFARSVNPAFGLLGMEVGAEAIRKQGKALGFNKRRYPPRLIPSTLTVPDSGYALAEISCGFTTSTNISPIHALDLARMIGSQSSLETCYFSDSLLLLTDGRSYPVDSKRQEPENVSALTLIGLQELMETAVTNGTCRRQFRRILKRHHLDKLIIGGKTGSLDGKQPKGRYDWFMGYARLKDNPEKGIAVVVMQVHQSYQSLRSGSVAALLFRDWLRDQSKKSAS